MSARGDHELYNLGKIIWIPAIILGFVFSNWGFERFIKGQYRCSFNSVTGLPCPGCGGTRAFVALFKGDIITSFLYNPTVILGIFLYIHFMGLYYYRYHIKKNIMEKPIHPSYYAYALICVILVQWIVKLAIIFIF